MVKYEIDKNRRVIAAMYTAGEVDVRDSLERMLYKIVDCNSIVNIDIDIDRILDKYEHQGRFTMIGVARCHEDDTWDEEKGKEIARNRLNRQFIVLKNDIMRDILNRLDNVYKHTVNKLEEKLYGKEVNKEYRKISTIKPVTVYYNPNTMEVEE